MQMFSRCCECGHKVQHTLMGGRVPDTEPCTECQGDRRNLQVGGDKPAWFDQDNDKFLESNKR